MAYEQIFVPTMSYAEYDNLSPEDKFYHQICTIEAIKNEYTSKVERISAPEWLRYKDERLAKQDRAERLTKLRLEVVDKIQTRLMSAARIFGYNPKFDVRVEGSEVWYRPRNKSAERMMERVDYLYMHKELQRG